MNKKTKRSRTNCLIITRHEALVEVLIRDHRINADKVVAHATVEDVEGKVVIGVLPMHLAAKAAKVGVLNLDLPLELRGRELTIEQVRQYAAPTIEWYVVRTESDQQDLLDDANLAGWRGSLAPLATKLPPDKSKWLAC